MAKPESRRRFIIKTAAVTAGLSFGIPRLRAARFATEIKEEGSFNLKRDGRTISFSLPISGNLSAVEVRIFSKANTYIFEYDDTSTHAPKVENEQTQEVWMADFDKATLARKKSSREQRFPVVDLVEFLQKVLHFHLNVGLLLSRRH